VVVVLEDDSQLPGGVAGYWDERDVAGLGQRQARGKRAKLERRQVDQGWVGSLAMVTSSFSTRCSHTSLTALPGRRMGNARRPGRQPANRASLAWRQAGLTKKYQMGAAQRGIAEKRAAALHGREPDRLAPSGSTRASRAVGCHRAPAPTARLPNLSCIPSWTSTDCS
jgi:hypothetical protein